jgi:hypothetical protein
MVKIHVYHNGGKSSTIRSNHLGLTILRQDSVRDKQGYKSKKGQQLVMLDVFEQDGELVLRNVRTGDSLRID